MTMKWMFAAVALAASASAFAQDTAPAAQQAPAEVAAPAAAQPAAPAVAAAAKAKASKSALLIAGGAALGVVALDNMSGTSDDRPSSP